MKFMNALLVFLAQCSVVPNAGKLYVPQGIIGVDYVHQGLLRLFGHNGALFDSPIIALKFITFV